MKNYIYLLIIFVTPVSAIAQAPGFMGRRFSVQFDPLFNLAFLNQTDLRNISGNPCKGVNVMWSASGDYVFKSNHSLGIDFHYLSTVTTPTDPLQPYYYPYVGTEAFFFGVHWKKFFGRNLAPVGPYMKIEAGGVYGKSTIYTSDLSRKTHYIHNGTIYGFASFGNNHILFRRLLLTYGVQIGFAGAEGALSQDYSSGSGGVNFKMLDDDIRVRLTFHTMYNFYGGIGVIF